MSRIAPTAVRHAVDALRRALGGTRWRSDVPTSEQDTALVPDGGRRNDRDEDAEHLRDVPDGAGCTEIWEHLSERTGTEAEAEADD